MGLVCFFFVVAAGCLLHPRPVTCSLPPIIPPADQFRPAERLNKAKVFGIEGFKPTLEDILRRQSPDEYDSSSDEDISDPLLYQPMDVHYVQFLLNNRETDFDRETIRFWQNDAKERKFTNFDPCW